MTTETQAGTQIISVNDFKHWILGVESMMDADWHPSKEQWIKIRKKIGELDSYNLFDVIEGVVAQMREAGSYSRPQPTYSSPPPMLQSAISPSPVFAPPVTQVAPAFVPPPTEFGAKTPDIDTSNGVYMSSFA